MTILYIGNNLTKYTKYPTALKILTEGLREQGFKVKTSSSKKNQVIRLLDMCLTVIKNRRADYVLIDTYSTLNFYYALIISQLCRMFNLKYISILHGGNLPSRLENSKVLSKLIFKNSYINVAPSNYLDNAFKDNGFNTIIIPNAIDLKQYTFLERKKIEPKILWVRTIKNLYNPQLAIKILYDLKKKYPRAKLCIVGPIGEEVSYKECLSLIKEYKLEKAVKFTGVLSKKRWHKLSVNYDVFLNTTNYDNTPVSVIEAMALGLTVISTNVGGIPFLLKDRYDSYLYGKGEVKSAVTIIEEVIKNNNQDIAFNARKKADSFDCSVVNKKWSTVLI